MLETFRLVLLFCLIHVACLMMDKIVDLTDAGQIRGSNNLVRSEDKKMVDTRNTLEVRHQLRR
jgi:hypothetical protein